MKPASAACLMIALAGLASTARPDPLHAIARDAYWHHESNFIFPITLGTLTRLGAPQERDGSSAVTAYYAAGTGASRVLVELELEPDGESTAAGASTTKESGAPVYRVLNQGGWRIVVRASAPDAAARSQVDALVRSLPLNRLGAIDTRCPDTGCGD